MRHEAKVVGRMEVPDGDSLFLDHVNSDGADYSNRKLHSFEAFGSCFKRCSFNNIQAKEVCFGSGMEQTEYIGCTFDGARFNHAHGGFARFVQCSFRNVRIRDWMSFAVEMIDCTLSGSCRGGIFNGSVPEEDRSFTKREHNEFYGNDFSGMDLIDVAFRTGIDLSRQRLPTGPEYVYLPDASAAIKQGFKEVNKWPDSKLREDAYVYLQALGFEASRGQRQLLLRARSADEADARVFEILSNYVRNKVDAHNTTPPSICYGDRDQDQ